MVEARKVDPAIGTDMEAMGIAQHGGLITAQRQAAEQPLPICNMLPAIFLRNLLQSPGKPLARGLQALAAMAQVGFPCWAQIRAV